VLDNGSPFVVQIVARLTELISDGELGEGDRAPSSHELADFYRINPATAAHALNVLIERGVLEQRGGLGMFVTPGTADRLMNEQRSRFAEGHISPIVAEAERLGIGAPHLVRLVREASRGRHDAGA
jgi:DNA-binding transcriptional regulator YhcF (GntR family)